MRKRKSFFNKPCRYSTDTNTIRNYRKIIRKPCKGCADYFAAVPYDLATGTTDNQQSIPTIRYDF